MANLPFAEDHQSRFAGVAAVGLSQRRDSSLKRAMELGLPNRKIESWKYSSVKFLEETAFRSGVADPGVTLQALSPYLYGDGPRIVFVNGRWHPGLSNVGELPDGVKVRSLRAVLNSQPEVLEARMAAGSDADFFESLNQAFLEEGIVIEVEKNAVIETPIQILHYVDATQSAEAEYYRSFISVGAFAKVSFVETFAGAGSYFRSLCEDVVVNAGANVSYLRVLVEGDDGAQVGKTKVTVARDASVQTLNLCLGSKLGRHELTVDLQEPGASAVVNGLYLLDKTEVVDNQINVLHTAPNCTSRQLYKGILSGQSRGVFSGRIYIPPHSVGTNSEQLNKNLLLSRGAEVDTKPQLEVHADDVKANHGAAIGRLDPEELFYLESRGINSDIAVGMLAYAFIDEVLMGIQDPQVLSQVKALFYERFAKFNLEEIFHGL